MKKSLLSVLALVLLPLSVFQAGCSSGKADPTDPPDAGRTNFTFMVILNRSVTGADQILFNGHASFNRDEVEGGGSFTRFTPCTPTPPATSCVSPIVAFGTWKAKRLLSFTSFGTFGADEAGILETDADLVFADGSVTPVMVKVVCNIAAGNLQTGQPGGVTLTLPDGTKFVASASKGDGFTIFTTTVEERD